MAGANDRFLVNPTIRWRGQEWLLRVVPKAAVCRRSGERPESALCSRCDTTASARPVLWSEAGKPGDKNQALSSYSGGNYSYSAESHPRVGTMIIFGAALVVLYLVFWAWHSPWTGKLTKAEIDRYLAIIERRLLPADHIKAFHLGPPLLGRG
jgi:hypothetical protein